MNSSIHIWQVTNLKNGTHLLKVESENSVMVSEYTERTLTLEIENAYAGKSQVVSILGEIRIGKEKMRINGIGEIVHLQAVEGSLVRFEFKLIEVDETIWKSFLNSKQSAQNHIDSLLKKMKGDT